MGKKLDDKLTDLESDTEHDIVREVLEALYMGEDGQWDPDKELDSDTAENVAKVFSERGLTPTKEDREQDDD